VAAFIFCFNQRQGKADAGDRGVAASDGFIETYERTEGVDPRTERGLEYRLRTIVSGIPDPSAVSKQTAAAADNYRNANGLAVKGGCRWYFPPLK
jgi:hypothetical protein